MLPIFEAFEVWAPAAVIEIHAALYRAGSMDDWYWFSTFTFMADYLNRN